MGLGLSTSQTTNEANDNGRHASIVKEKRAPFAFEMRYSFLYFFSLVRISEFLHAISRPLAYGVRISSKASATAVSTSKRNENLVPQK